MFSRRKREREQMVSMMDSLQKALVSIAEAHKEQARVFSTFLDSFKITEPPARRVINDADELRLEMEESAEKQAKQGGQWTVPAPQWLVVGED